VPCARITRLVVLKGRTHSGTYDSVPAVVAMGLTYLRSRAGASANDWQAEYPAVRKAFRDIQPNPVSGIPLDAIPDRVQLLTHNAFTVTLRAAVDDGSRVNFLSGWQRFLRTELDADRPVLVYLPDWSKLGGGRSGQVGHMVLVTGLTDREVVYADPWSGSSVRVPHQVVTAAWSTSPFGAPSWIAGTFVPAWQAAAAPVAAPTSQAQPRAATTPRPALPPSVAQPGVPTLIAYAGDDGNIWLTQPDGTGRRAVTEGGSHDAPFLQPRWSADGKELTFVAARRDSVSGGLLFVASYRYRDNTILAVPRSAGCEWPTRLPGQDRLALLCNRRMHRAAASQEELETWPSAGALSAASLDGNTWWPVLPYRREADFTQGELTPLAQISVDGFQVSPSDGAILLEVQSVGPVRHLALRDADGNHERWPPAPQAPGQNGYPEPRDPNAWGYWRRAAFAGGGQDIVALWCARDCGVMGGAPGATLTSRLYRPPGERRCPHTAVRLVRHLGGPPDAAQTSGGCRTAAGEGELANPGPCRGAEPAPGAHPHAGPTTNNGPATGGSTNAGAAGSAARAATSVQAGAESIVRSGANADAPHSRTAAARDTGRATAQSR
jgi:hypothetical protein